MATEFYLKLDGIDGEAQGVWDKQIQLTSFGFSSTSPTDAASGQATGKVRYSDITCIKQVDAASARLLKAISQNQRISTAKISAVKSGAGDGKPYLTIELTNARVTSWNFSATSESPGETVTLGYRRIIVSYFGQTGKGLLTMNSSVDIGLDTN